MTEIERIKAILKNSQAIIFYWKAEEGWPVEYVSENISMFGYQASDFLSGHIPYSSIVYPADLIRVSEEVATYTKMHQDEFRQVYRLLDANGDIRWIDDRTVIERDEEGQPTYYVGTIIDITEQKQAEEHSLLLGNVVKESSEEVYIFERGTLQFTYLNNAAIDNLGFSLEEAKNLTPLDIKSDLDISFFVEKLTQLIETENPVQSIAFETTMQRKDGTVYPAEAKVQAMDVDGRLQFVAVIHDISEHLALLEEQAQRHEFIQNVIDGISNTVVMIDRDYNLQMMNRAAQLDLEHSRFKGKQHIKCYQALYDQDEPCHGEQRHCPLKEALEKKHEVNVVHERQRNGNSAFYEILAKPLQNSSGNVTGIVESAHDITELMLAQERLQEQANESRFQATHDSLTGLPNRRLFLDRLEQSLQRAKRLNSLVAVVFVDVDKFKPINDSLGHQAGDEVLIEVAKRLKSSIRSCDTVARMGGDEFTLILEAFQNIDDIKVILQKLTTQFIQPIQTHKGSVELTLSVGSACYPQDGEHHKELLHNADIALYDVKTNGRNDVRCFHQLKPN